MKSATKTDDGTSTDMNEIIDHFESVDDEKPERCNILLCCVVLCYFVLCCAILCCVVLCYVGLCYIVLCFLFDCVLVFHIPFLLLFVLCASVLINFVIFLRETSFHAKKNERKIQIIIK